MKIMIRAVLSLSALSLVSCSSPEPAIALQKNAADAFKHLPDPEDRVEPPSWQSFTDREVGAIVARVRSSNTDLRAAAAQSREFLALIRSARSASFLQLDGRAGAGADVRSSGLNGDFSGGLSAALEIDLWGRLRKATEAAVASADASIAAQDSLQLALEAQAVATYYTIHSIDSQIDSTNGTIARLEEIGSFVDREIEAGLVGTFERARVDSAVGTLKGDRATLQRARNRFENALAVLVGANASTFTVRRKGLKGAPPAVSVYLPSRLLERRPDIHEAKALLDANQAGIGVAWADFFPRLNLLALLGVSSPSVGNLFRGGEDLSVGGDLLGPIIDGGRRRANYQAAIARRDRALALLEGTVLRAFEDTENALSDVKVLESEYDARLAAVRRSRETNEGVRRRYRDGIDSLFQLISVELQLNERELQLQDVRGQQFVAAADLVRALGGDWRR